MSCDNCTISPQGQDVGFEAAQTKAVEFSKQNNVAVSIYKEGFEWKFMEAFAAFRAGLGPAICTTISKYH